MMKKWLTLLAMTAGLVSTGNAADINRLKTFTGVASQWPWQLNTDGTWTSAAGVLRYIWRCICEPDSGADNFNNWRRKIIERSH